MQGLVTHPNVGGSIFVTLGCASTNSFRLPKKASEAGKLVEIVNFHKVGGTSQSVQVGVEMANKMAEKLRRHKREPVDMSAVVLGTKCGSSDNVSGDVLHPVTGITCDRIVDEGGTVVLAENYELLADIEALAARAVNGQVKADVLKIRTDLVELLKARHGQAPEPTEQGKISSFKHASKAGTRPIQRVIPLQGQIKGPGLVIHDGPNSDLVSVTTMAVAGCNLQLFTTGRGTPVGGPCAPTIKVTATPRTQNLMAENIDVGVAEVTEGKISHEEGAERIYQAILRVARGELTKSERLGHFEMQFHIKGVTF